MAKEHKHGKDFHDKKKKSIWKLRKKLWVKNFSIISCFTEINIYMNKNSFKGWQGNSRFKKY